MSELSANKAPPGVFGCFWGSGGPGKIRVGHQHTGSSTYAGGVGHGTSRVADRGGWCQGIAWIESGTVDGTQKPPHSPKHASVYAAPRAPHSPHGPSQALLFFVSTQSSQAPLAVMHFCTTPFDQVRMLHRVFGFRSPGCWGSRRLRGLGSSRTSYLSGSASSARNRASV